MTQLAEDKYIIGLTGNIATGKSTVAAMLAELGATVIDADKIAHQVMRRDSQVYSRVVAAFGPTVVDVDKEINRERLGRIVFSDPEALRRLEGIVHPAVGVEIGRRVREVKTRVVVIEAIKLLEAGIHHGCQAVWVTTCPPEKQIDRLIRERSLSFEDAERRVNAQPSQVQKISLAESVSRLAVIIDTSGDLVETRNQVEKAWQAIGKGGNYGNYQSVSS